MRERTTGIRDLFISKSSDFSAQKGTGEVDEKLVSFIHNMNNSPENHSMFLIKKTGLKMRSHNIYFTAA